MRAGDLESGKAGELESMRPGELETLSKDSLARIPQPGIFKKICLGSPLESYHFFAVFSLGYVYPIWFVSPSMITISQNIQYSDISDDLNRGR